MSKKEPRISRLLTVSVSTTEAYNKNEEFEIYSIRVKTTDKLYAGTDNDVYINVKGVTTVERDGVKTEKPVETGEFLLDKSGRNDFERGNTDSFRIPAKAVGRVTNVIIRHRGLSLNLSQYHRNRNNLRDAANERRSLTMIGTSSGSNSPKRLLR